MLGDTDSALPLEPMRVSLEDEIKDKYMPTATAFTSLESSPALHGMLSMHPQLLAQLQTIYNATLEPLSDSQKDEHMRICQIDHGGGRVRGRGRGNIRGSRPSWTPQRGQRLALSQIRQIKACEGNHGDGIKEFSRLVMRLIDSEPSDEKTWGLATM